MYVKRSVILLKREEEIFSLGDMIEIRKPEMGRIKNHQYQTHITEIQNRKIWGVKHISLAYYSLCKISRFGISVFTIS